MIRFIPKLILLMVLFFIITGLSAYFTISYFIQNEEPVIMPTLTGQDIVDVLELLTGLGLNVRIKGSEYSSDVAENNIIYQDPAPGEVIKRGRDVRIIISKGTKTLPMPNLKGLNLQQVRLILDKNGLKEGNISRTFHPAVKRDRIIAQHPISGKTIERGISPDLLVSRGMRPPEFVMPDLRSLYLDDAVLAAEKNHLVIDTIKTVYQKNKTANTVLSQDPLPGYHYFEHQLINLVVNRKTGHGSESRHIGDRHIKDRPTALFRYRLPSGYLKQHIRVELRAFGTTVTLYDELMKPEKEIWVAVPAYSVAVIFVYKNNELIMSEIFD
jgi:beta-lactam-binding protein with PASTA domain